MNTEIYLHGSASKRSSMPINSSEISSLFLDVFLSNPGLFVVNHVVIKFRLLGIQNGV